MEQQIQHIGRHDQQTHPKSHPHVDKKLLCQFRIEERYLKMGAHTGQAGKKPVGDKTAPAGSHHNGKEEVLTAKSHHGTQHHGHQCLEETGAQFTKMIPEIHLLRER
jgi:hypothetical protein